MRSWILAAGLMDNLPFYRSLKIKEDDLVICADGGYDHARLIGIKPSVVIGDMDSINMSVDLNTRSIKYPREKDKTDTQLAVEYAIDNGSEEIIILGAMGGRVDHTLANVMLLSLIADRGADGMIITDQVRLTLITGDTDIRRGKGDHISFIPLTEQVTGITTQGFLYNMDNVTIKKGDTLALSNEFRAHAAHIKIDSGRLLVVCDI